MVTDREVKQELTALAACADTVRQLANNKAVGEFLVEEFTAKPYLVKYWRSAASAGPIGIAMQKRLLLDPKCGIAGLVVSRTLLVECGVRVTLLQKVFAKCGLARIDNPIAEPSGLKVRITSCGSIPIGHVTAVFEVDGVRFGNATFLMNAEGQKGLAALRAIMPFEVPTYVEPWGKADS